MNFPNLGLLATVGIGDQGLVTISNIVFPLLPYGVWIEWDRIRFGYYYY